MKNPGNPSGPPDKERQSRRAKRAGQSACAFHSACHNTSCSCSLPYAWHPPQKHFAYQADMFIPRLLRFVNRFFENAPHAFRPALPRIVPKRTKGIDDSRKMLYNIVKQYVLKRDNVIRRRGYERTVRNHQGRLYQRKEGGAEASGRIGPPPPGTRNRRGCSRGKLAPPGQPARAGERGQAAGENRHAPVSRRFWDCVMPREGIFVIVLEEGDAKAGDRVTLENS